MAAHLVTLYDEFHRTIILNDELSAKAGTQISIENNGGKHSLIITSGGLTQTYPLQNVKVPPKTGVEDFAKRFLKLIKAK